MPFIEGDGTGRDIWRASQRVFDAAVEKAYGGTRKVAWFEIFAGEKAFQHFQTWLPDDTVNAARDLRVSIKGPLTTPVGGGIRSLNVTLRQMLDLYACVRPVRWYQGVPSPVKHPERMNITIFRENTEDVYAGIEWKEGSEGAKKLIHFLNGEMLGGGKKRVRADSGVGIKPISITGTKRLVRYAIAWALKNGKRSVTLVHKGNIQKYTEGAFREWGYEVAIEEFRDQVVTERESWILGNRDKNPDLTAEDNAVMIEPGLEYAPEAYRQSVYDEVRTTVDALGATHGEGKWKSKLLINDRIADSIFQQIIIRPEEYQVLATTNLNGDYLSDAAAAQVGGLGHRPRRQHRRWLRRLRSHPRHRAQIRRQGRHQSGLGDPLRGDDVRLSGLAGGGAHDRGRDGAHHPAEDRDLRFRAADGRRDQGRHQQVRRPHHRTHEVRAGERTQT